MGEIVFRVIAVVVPHHAVMGVVSAVAKTVIVASSVRAVMAHQGKAPVAPAEIVMIEVVLAGLAIGIVVTEIAHNASG